MFARKKLQAEDGGLQDSFGKISGECFASSGDEKNRKSCA